MRRQIRKSKYIFKIVVTKRGNHQTSGEPAANHQYFRERPANHQRITSTLENDQEIVRLDVI